eukprot:m.101315 g.101315  ORF g.101315 m.101315 type:complete len:90 (+) comp37125_c0_seq1:514-783(+)
MRRMAPYDGIVGFITDVGKTGVPIKIGDDGIGSGAVVVGVPRSGEKVEKPDETAQEITIMKMQMKKGGGYKRPRLSKLSYNTRRLVAIC